MTLASSESLDSDDPDSDDPDSDDENEMCIAAHHESAAHQSPSPTSFVQIDPRCIEEEDDYAEEMVSINDSSNDSGTDDDECIKSG